MANEPDEIMDVVQEILGDLLSVYENSLYKEPTKEKRIAFIEKKIEEGCTVVCFSCGACEEEPRKEMRRGQEVELCRCGCNIYIPIAEFLKNFKEDKPQISVEFKDGSIGFLS